MSALPVGKPTIAGAASRYRIVVATALVLALAVGLAYALSRPVQYTATAGLVLDDPRSAPVFGNPLNGPPDRYVSDQISVLKSSDVERAASDAAAQQVPSRRLSPDFFSAHTTVSDAQRDANVVRVSVSAGDSATALAGVDALVNGYENVTHTAVSLQLSSVLSQIDAATKSIDVELAGVESQLAAAVKSGAPQQGLLAQQQALLGRRATLGDKHDQMTVNASRQSTGVFIYLQAGRPTSESRLISALPVIALAAATGLLLGVGSAYALARRGRLSPARSS